MMFATCTSENGAPEGHANSDAYLTRTDYRTISPVQFPCGARSEGFIIAADPAVTRTNVSSTLGLLRTRFLLACNVFSRKAKFSYGHPFL